MIPLSSDPKKNCTFAAAFAEVCTGGRLVTGHIRKTLEFSGFSAANRVSQF